MGRVILSAIAWMGKSWEENGRALSFNKDTCVLQITLSQSPIHVEPYRKSRQANTFVIMCLDFFLMPRMPWHLSVFLSVCTSRAEIILSSNDILPSSNDPCSSPLRLKGKMSYGFNFVGPAWCTS